LRLISLKSITLKQKQIEILNWFQYLQGFHTNRCLGGLLKRIESAANANDEAIDEEHFAWLQELLSLEPHLEYEEMAGRISEFHSIEYTAEQVRYSCHEHGITRKRLELQAKEQDDAQRAIYRATVRLDFEGGAFREDQFVFGDESHGTLAVMRRKYGYADHGLPAFRRVFDSKGNSQGCSGIAFLNVEGSNV